MRTLLLVVLLLAGCATVPDPQTRSVCYNAYGVSVDRVQELHDGAAAHFARQGVTFDPVVIAVHESQDEAPFTDCDITAVIVPRFFGPHMVARNGLAHAIPMAGAAKGQNIIVQTGLEYRLLGMTPTGTLIHELGHALGCNHPPLVPIHLSC